MGIESATRAHERRRSLSFDSLSDVNWLAIIVGTIIYMVLGFLWYGPLFGKAFIAATGYSPPEEGQDPGPAIYAAPGIAYLIMSIATAMLAEATGSTTVGEGVVLGLVLGVGFAVTLTLVSSTFSQGLPSPWALTLITGSYNLVALVIVAVLVSAW